MRWNVADNEPPIARSTGAVLLNGQRVEKVTAFDEEAGWVEVLCTDGHTGEAGRAHLDPQNEDEVCRTVLRGSVEYRP